MDNPLLSILILTIDGREDNLKRLMQRLRPQVEYGIVELIVKKDRHYSNGGGIVGDRRNEALQDAAGDYCCFVDDDDMVSEDYVAKILSAIETRPDVVGITGHYTAGGKTEKFVHSMKWTDWFTKDDIHYRCPNHLNPVKRELALQAGFTSKNHGEDMDYSMNLRPLLKTEVMIDDVIYFYIK